MPEIGRAGPIDAAQALDLNQSPESLEHQTLLLLLKALPVVIIFVGVQQHLPQPLDDELRGGGKGSVHFYKNVPKE